MFRAYRSRRKSLPSFLGKGVTKFGNTVIGPEESHDGRKYHSAGEHLRSIELTLLAKSGQIQDLQFQVPFRLVVNERVVCKYYADFVYIEGGLKVVEDFKGAETGVFKLKWKMMAAMYPDLVLRITKAKDLKKKGASNRRQTAQKKKAP